jgi:serine/threonine protein kinase
MKQHHSTLRPDNGSTVAEIAAMEDVHALERLIADEWEQLQVPDLVGAIQRHPQVLENRSVLLNLAMREYRGHRSATADLELERHCSRFRQFGHSIEQSILRQLEAQQYLDEHPELLEYLSATQWPAVGETFGSFTLEEQLGSGGSARVYLARQADIGDRRVVIKATPYASIEASVLGRLSHPNIVPIHFADVVEEYQLNFICMPYCGRSTLVDLIDLAFERGIPTHAQVIPQASLKWLPQGEKEAAQLQLRSKKPGPPTYVGAVLRLALQIADALQHAHERGILHGDLKPSNILLTPAGTPLVLDFNLSRDEFSNGLLCGGTLAYMPPEQLRFIAKQGDAAKPVPSGVTCDIYSFGALLYELLVGHPPLQLSKAPESPDVAAAGLLDQLNRPLPSVRENTQVPHGLAALIMQCLSFDPNARPQSMEEVGRRLTAEARWTKEVQRTTRRHPILVGTLLLLLGGGAAAAGSWWTSLPSTHIAHYQRGVAAAAAADWKAAEESFLQALRVQPDYAAAQLELGRAYLAREEFDLALATLDPLALEGTPDPEVMELVAYIFNLKNIPAGAIKWYERSLAHGGGSLAAYNNLAASYLSGVPKLSMEVRCDMQEKYLTKALAIDSDSIAVHINFVRHHIVKANADLNYDPSGAQEHAERLEIHEESSLLVKQTLEHWRATVRTRKGLLESLSERGQASVGAAYGNASSQAPQHPTENHDVPQSFSIFYLKPSLAP